MTTHLFSQLISKLTGDISPSGIQKRILALSSSEITQAQSAGLYLFWASIADATGQNGMALDPSTVMAVLAGLPEVHEGIDNDFFFI